MRWRAALAVLLAVAAAAATAQDTVSELVYTTRDGAPCVRLLNATGVIGCQGTRQRQQMSPRRRCRC